MANQYKNEVVYNGQTLINLKEDTVTPEKVLDGETFHDRSGAPQTGSMVTHNVYDGLDSTSVSDALSSNQGRILNEKYNALNSNTPKLVVNESIDGGSSKTYSFRTGKLYQIICAHPYGQGYFAIYAGGSAGAARLNEIKTSSNVTVSVTSNANQVTISAVGQATYVRILEL